MSTEVNPTLQLDIDQVAFLNKLEQQIQEDLTEIRAYERMDISASVAISPADSSRAGEPTMTGTTINLSRGGCMVSVSNPPRVGDHYRIQIQSDSANPIMTFARCVRAMLGKGEVFEAGFQFFTPLELAEFETAF